MTSYIKKRYRAHEKDQNILYLKRFKKRTPRWHRYKKYEVAHNNKVETKGFFLLGQMGIRKGKKTQSLKRTETLFLTLKKKYPQRDIQALITNLLHKFRALIYLRAKRLGSVTYKIPISLYKKKGLRVMARWIMNKENARKYNIVEKNTENILNLLRKQGDIFKKRRELHKLGYAGIPYLTYLKRDSINK